jgi:epoxyqueuosine reductase QueG
VAAGNALRQSPAEPQGLRAAVSALLHHDSDLVREHAAWALQA